MIKVYSSNSIYYNLICKNIIGYKKLVLMNMNNLRVKNLILIITKYKLKEYCHINRSTILRMEMN